MHIFRENGSEVDYTLIYPLEKLILSLKKNQIYKGELEFEVKPRCEISGFLYASHYRMKCVQESFRADYVKLSYSFDASGLEEGDEVRGFFSIVTEIGEYYMPFEVTIMQPLIMTSLGEMRNLFHFVNLARTNWEEAVDVFYKPEFMQLFGGSDRQYKSAYRGLLANPANEANVEEFLMLLRKKQPVSYELEENEKEIRRLDEVRQELFVRRNSWGYTHIALHTDADFIELEKEVLSDKDFVGNRAGIVYVINAQKLHWGKNYGRICLDSGLDSLSYQVCVEVERPISRQETEIWDMKKLTMQLMEEYLHFRMKREKRKVWLTNSERIVEQMTVINSKNFSARLFETHLLILQKRKNEAKWMLKHIADLMERKGKGDGEYNYGEENFCEVYAYYLFLSSMLMEAEADKKAALEEVKELLGQNKDSFRILWILCYMDKNLKKDSSRKLGLLEEQFMAGGNSPLLYMELAYIYRRNPVYLNALSKMSLQTLRFAARYGILNQELIRQILYVFARQKTLTPPMYEILEACYNMQETDEILLTICTLLIKSGMVDRQYFRWYELAVKKELRITRLYDYYLMSLDLKQSCEIPKMVLLYFAYQCDLDYSHKAYLYAYVVRKEKELPEIYQSYVSQMEHFVYEQVLAGHVNPDLVYLYKQLITERMVDEKFAAALAEILFMHQVKVLEKQIKFVVLVEEKSCKERKYPLQEAQTIFPIYDGEEYALLFETAEGNRYIQGVSFQDQELFMKQRLLQMIQKQIPSHFGYALFFCENHSDFSELEEAELERIIQVFYDTSWLEEYRKQIGTKLVQYYFDQNRMEQMDDILAHMELTKVSQKERGELVKLLLIREQYQKACEILMQYGFEGISVKYLLLLFQYSAETGVMSGDRMLALANYLFERGKADKEVLKYLSQHFEGNAKQMRDIWENARAYDLPVKELSENIIKQTLLSDAYVANKQEIFQYYYSQGGDPAVIDAYLSKCAYQYLVKEELMDENIFAIMLETEALSDIAKLAVVYFFSRHNRNMSIQEKLLVKEHIQTLIAQDIYFPFFNQFADLLPELLTAVNKTFVEYKTQNKAKVILHYIRNEDGENSYHKEEMKELYKGYFCKSFILFFGERLQYYITEIVGDNEKLTESKTIEKGELLDTTVESRYNLLNHIVASQALEEYDSLESLMLEYAQKSFLADRLFEIR